MTPAYRISPFQTSDIALNRTLPASTKSDRYFETRFGERPFIYCESGRHALNLALSNLRLARDDVVTILTTTGNHYVSGCVTREIEKFCRWSRRFENQTKCLLVNHEFGFAYEKLRELSNKGLPIIEDAAHSFASNNAEASLGAAGDYVIYSFPKFFPIQVGGLLVGPKSQGLVESVSPECRTYLQRVISHYLERIDEWSAARRDNHTALAQRFESEACSPRFGLSAHSAPGVFMFRAPDRVDLPALKVHMQEHGIESSVFYGEQAFFVPTHHRLQEADLDYFLEAYKTKAEKLKS